MELRLQLSVAPFRALPLRPEFLQAVYECLRLVRVKTLAESESLVLEFLASPIDEIGCRRSDSRTQHREVVLIAEVVSEVMELVGQLADRARGEQA